MKCSLNSKLSYFILILLNLSVLTYSSAEPVDYFPFYSLQPKKKQDVVLSDYSYNPHVPLEVWKQLKPFFLPVDHPIKSKLDRLFCSTRATLSKEDFESAGFGKIKERQPTNIVVGRHSSLKGYLIKAYLDTQPAIVEWVNWVARITGAQSIRDCLNRHGYSYFRVPKKWIYPLPVEPSPPLNANYNRKNFILVVEDMHILSSRDNLKAYQKHITTHILDAFYVILKEEGLIDSIYPDNVPFTQSGKLAFIDTEHHHHANVEFSKLKKFLSPAMQNYWQMLIDQGVSEN